VVNAKAHALELHLHSPTIAPVMPCDALEPDWPEFHRPKSVAHLVFHVENDDLHPTMQAVHAASTSLPNDCVPSPKVKPKQVQTLGLANPVDAEESLHAA